MLQWIAETTLVAAGLAMVALLGSRLRTVGPTARHALWLVVMIRLLVPPVVAWPWATSWQILNSPMTSVAAVSRAEETASVDRDRPRPIRSRAEPISVKPVFEELGAERTEISPAPVELSEFVEPSVPDTLAAPVSWFPVKWPALPDVGLLLPWLGWAWLVISVGLGVGQTIRIIRFRRRIRAAIPAPDELFEETESISRQFGVSMPQLLVVSELGTPMLWCLGRPQLLLPARLVKALPLDLWRGILIHELAHLRRGDHWVSRLELAAGLIWWWNPLYWLTRARLNAEAELACDAWVVTSLPNDRLAYAEVLFDICAKLSLAKPPAPTLSVAGSGHFFERRLIMILREHVPCRLSPAGLLGACLLLLLALPSWSAMPAVLDQNSLEMNSIADRVNQPSIDDDDDDDKRPDEKAKVKEADDDDADADDDEDEADDDDGEADDDNEADDDDAAAHAKSRAKKPKSRAKKSDSDIDVDVSAIEKEIEDKFGPGSEFETKMEELGEKLSKEMEAKFGSGSDFAKKMEAFGKEMEAKFGSGSDFGKKMEAFGKEMEAKFGPGSDFEKKMRALGEEMKEKYGSGSDFAELKPQSGADVKAEKKVKAEKRSSQAEAGKAKVKAEVKDRKRERRIQELEAQVRKLVAEIQALKSHDNDKDDDKE